MTAHDEKWMQQALQLAVQGRGCVEPNPMVGAVVLSADGALCGTGWHQQFGGPHAEVFALQSAGEQTRGGTLYVTLEPCNHHGKTPPCTAAVITSGVRRVVVGCEDPAAHVNRAGIAQLRAAGIEVEVGVLETAALDLIAPFHTLQVQQRPFVHAKWAMTLDGRIASRTGHSQWISSSESRELVHRLRGQMDGILVGSGTARMDDPLLTARPAGPRTATRIVLDSQAQLPLNSQLVQTARQVPVLLFAVDSAPTNRIQQLQLQGIEVCQLPPDTAGRPQLVEVLLELGRRNLTNILVEGGSHLLGSLWDAQLIDELHVFIAPKLIGGETALGPVGGVGLSHIPAVAILQQATWRQLGTDLYLTGRVTPAK